MRVPKCSLALDRDQPVVQNRRHVTAAESTCWTVIRGAAEGKREDRELFARRYTPVVRAYLGARWRGSPLLAELDDATQEVFLDCFREQGALGRADPARGVAFRAFLRGIVRNVARRCEEGRGRGRERQPPSSEFEVEAREERLSRVFDRAWARSLMQEAAARHAGMAHAQGDGAVRRVELLRLRFHEGMPIREIADLWDADAATLHREYAKARREFKRALLEVVAFHHPGSAEDVERECAELLDLLRSET